MNRIPAALAAASLLAVAGCTSINTEPDEVGLHYSGGAITSTQFANCVAPGTRNWDGPGDPHYKYPAGQRTYKFGDGKGSDHAAVKAVTKDNVQLSFTGTVTFSLDQTCTMLRRFHEQVGLKDWGGAHAYISDGNYTGWNNMLDVYIGQPLQRAINQTAGDFGYKDLYNGNQARAKAEAEVQQSLPGFVKQLAGDDYFRHFNVALQKPDAPADIVRALEAEQEAVAQNNAQKQQNQRSRTQYDTFTDCKKILSEANCVLLYGINSGKVTVIPVPEGSGLAINPR
jgi:SPFH domain/Band 7 family protein